MFRKVVDRPTLLETFGYILFYPSSIIGPSFEFKDFKKFINLEEEYSNLPKRKCMFAGMKTFLVAVSCMTSFLVLKDKLELFWVSSDEYSNKSIFYKIGYYMLSTSLVIRARYYTGFKLAESSVIFCGLSYDNNKKDRMIEENKEEIKHDFTKIENVKITYFEFKLDPNDKINYWNRSVHLWLKYQVYFRLINLPHKFFNKKYEVATFFVFIISALWHGFYPGYYIFFIQMFFFQRSIKVLDKKINFFKYMESSNIILRTILNHVIVFTIGSLGYAFCVLDIENSLKFYKTLYFIPNIILISLFIFTTFILKGDKTKKMDTKENKVD